MGKEHRGRKQVDRGASRRRRDRTLEARRKDCGGKARGAGGGGGGGGEQTTCTGHQHQCACLVRTPTHTCNENHAACGRWEEEVWTVDTLPSKSRLPPSCSSAIKSHC